jgi:hypothetical protein
MKLKLIEKKIGMKIISKIEFIKKDSKWKLCLPLGDLNLLI